MELCWESENAVHPFPLIAEQRKYTMVIVKRLSTRSFLSSSFSSFKNYILIMSNLSITKYIFFICKINHFYDRAVQFLNLYRTFKSADRFIIHFISVAKEERELWSPMSEKHCCLQPMDQTHTHTYVHTHVRDTCSYTREIRNSKKRTVIGKSEGCFWRRKMAGVKMLDSAGAYYQLNIFMKVPWHRQRLREVIGRMKKETPYRGFPIVVLVWFRLRIYHIKSRF